MKLKTLQRLTEVRQGEVDDLTRELGRQQQLRDRFVNNIEKLRQLTASAGASGSLPMALSTSCAEFKSSLLHVLLQQEQELAVQEIAVQRARDALQDALRRREVIDHVRQQEQDAVALAAARREQKRHDELASQAWQRQG